LSIDVVGWLFGLVARELISLSPSSTWEKVLAAAFTTPGLLQPHHLHVLVVFFVFVIHLII
jgi:hypothetical protein